MEISNALGALNLSNNQIQRISQAHSARVKHFKTLEDQFFAITEDTPLTPAEISAVISQLQALDASPLEPELEFNDFLTNPIRGKTPAEAEAWVQANVNNLADAKNLMGKMARVIAFMLRRQKLR